MRFAAVIILALVTASWAAWLTAVPAVAASADGGPVLGAAALTYRAAAFICHQQDARSFHVAGIRMPVCSRCFGLYAGAALGASLAAGWIAVRRRHASRYRLRGLTALRWGMAVTALPTAAAWAAEHLAGLTVPADVRALAALPLGASVAALVACWAAGVPVDDAAAGSALH